LNLEQTNFYFSFAYHY